jgi:trehalose 6-phosphate phosphatase
MAEILIPERHSLPPAWKMAIRQGIRLFLDFDGTLVDIQPHPDLVRLPLETQNTIGRLLDHKGVSICLVTGRDLANIRNFVAIPRLGFIASHGFEAWQAGVYWSHSIIPQIRPLLDAIHSQVSRLPECRQGVLIEAKTATLAIHFRGLPTVSAERLQRQIHKIITPYSNFLSILTGKMVLEIRPRALWTKGEAIVSWLEQLSVKTTGLFLFAGDDATDEEAFRRLPRNWSTIHIGTNANTQAHYCISTPEALRGLLSVLLEIKEET